MKDKRDKLIPEQLSGYTWELSGYAPKVPFSNSDSLSMREVRNAFQLTPEPPEMELNDYIREAVRKRDLSYFSFFLHHFENRLNGVIYRFLTRNGIDRYGPARFLDYKLEVLQMLLFCLPRFDPEQETEFLKYAKNYIRNGLLFCRALEEAGSFGSIAEYQRVRHIGAIYTDSGKSRAEVVAKFAEKAGYKEDGATADELLTVARHNRSIVSLYRTEQDEDGEETGEDVTCDDSWDYADILWNGVRARAVKRAFWEMELREQRLLEGRNAICMACGRVSPMKSTKKNKKIAAAVYLYQADNDGGWGELRFDFATGTAEIVRLAEWDTVKSNVFARTAIRYIQSLLEVRLLKEAVVPFEMDGPEKPIPPVKASKAPKRKALRTISLRQIEIQKTDERIAAAVYQYQVDNDGEWGEIRFDFATGTAEIVRLAEWDTIKSNIFARAAIRHIHSLPEARLPKERVVTLDVD